MIHVAAINSVVVRNYNWARAIIDSQFKVSEFELSGDVDQKLKVRPSFHTEDPVPTSIGPIVTPDGKRFPIGNGVFDLKIGLHDLPLA